MDVPFFRTPYNYDRDAVSHETGLECQDKTRTQQHFRDECDINTLVARFGIEHVVPEGTFAPVELTEQLAGASSYHDVLQLMVRGRESFMALPAEVRARFGNDAGAFVDFCGREDSWDELVRFGMVLPEAVDRRRKAAEKARQEAIDAEVRARLEKQGVKPV